MHTLRQSIGIFGIIIILSLTCALVFQAGAQNSAPERSARPTKVAIVDLSRLIDGLNKRQDAEAKLNQMRATIQEEMQQRDAELETMRQQRNEMEDASEAERQALDEKLARAATEYRAWAAWKSQELDIETATRLTDLYRDIRIAAREKARADGLDLVLFEDMLTDEELQPTPGAQVSRETQIKQKMHSTRTLYADAAIDITDDLIARMNNAFMRAGQ